jgi:RND superfamily putative drug exporter
MFSRLTHLATRRTRLVLGATVVFVLAAGLFGGPVAGLLSSGGSNFEDAGSESVAVRERLERAQGASPGVALLALVDAGSDVTSGEGRARLEAVAQAVRTDPAVARVAGYAGTGDPAFVSRDGTQSYLAVSFRPLSEEDEEAAVARIQSELADEPGVTLGGPVIAGEQIGEQVGEDLARAELLAFPLLFAFLLLFFRGVVAALLPLLVGLVSIVGTFFGLRLVNEAAPLSVFALNLATGVGLGLAIDYSLFVVSRYREELARVGPGVEAIRRTVATAGRTVLFSALTVAVALASLLVFPQPFLYSMGLAGIFVALLSGATALVVLPAVLALLGPRVNALSPARWRRSGEREAGGVEGGFWYRLSQAVMRRAAPVAVAAAALLVAAGVPFLGVSFTGVDASVLPASASARQVDDVLARDFPQDRGSPVYVALEAPGSAGGDVAAYAERARDLPGVAAVGEPAPVGDGLWRLDVISRAEPLAEESKALVRELRDVKTPLEVSVGGQTAGFLDLQSSLGSRLPVGLAVLALGTFALLFLMTGSVVLPLKALLMNLLTVSAAFGLAVVIFQDGNLEGLLDFTSQGALESTQPVLIFATVFALSTDYAVFLLTRIKEARDGGLPNTEAVATGLERTGRIVTAAALLFAVAIGAFSTSEIVFIKLLGVTTALAVLIDATVVRAFLVPALMKLLGEWNWWAPAPLRSLHRRVGLDETRSGRPAPSES